MLYLLDTNAFSDLMTTAHRVTERYRATSAAHPVIICTIVRGEILFGLERMPPGKRRAELSSNAQQLFGLIACDPIPAGVGDRYAVVKRTRQAMGLPLDENDCWIAATALHRGAVLVTRDADFRNVPGLTVEDWGA